MRVHLQKRNISISKQIPQKYMIAALDIITSYDNLSIESINNITNSMLSVRVVYKFKRKIKELSKLS